MFCRAHRNLSAADAEAMRQATFNSSRHEYDINPEAPLEGLHDHWQEQPAPRLKWWWWLLVGLICGLAYVLLLESSRAHDHDKPDLNAWMKTLRAPGSNVGCCSTTDATVLTNEEWQSNGTHYTVRLYGIWIDVPDGAVLKSPNLDGRTLIWPEATRTGDGGLRLQIRCFMAGAGT